MAIAAGLKKLFNKHKVDYQLLYYKETTSLYRAASYLNVPASSFVKSLVLHDKIGYVLVVLPLNAKIDYLKLKQKLNRNLHVLPDVKAKKIFHDCNANNFPPFGKPYKIDVIVDYAVKKIDKVCFSAGSDSSVVEMKISDFLYIN